MPKMGDAIGIIGHPRITDYLHWKAGWGIKQYQRWLCGFPEPARLVTHVVGFIGELEDSFVEALRLSGLLKLMAEESRVSEVYIAEELKDRGDICFEVTDPYARYCYWSDIQKRDWMLATPDFCAFDQQWQKAAWVNASSNIVGRRYDRKQLFGILLNEVAGIEDAQYKRWLDLSSGNTVCSGGIGAAYEGVRRAGKVQFEYHTGVPAGENDPWPRLFGGMHLERIPPAIYFALPWRASWKHEFSTISTARAT